MVAMEIKIEFQCETLTKYSYLKSKGKIDKYMEQMLVIKWEIYMQLNIEKTILRMLFSVAMATGLMYLHLTFYNFSTWLFILI
jgi:hypothetical protein